MSTLFALCRDSVSTDQEGWELWYRMWPHCSGMPPLPTALCTNMQRDEEWKSKSAEIVFLQTVSLDFTAAWHFSAEKGKYSTKKTILHESHSYNERGGKTWTCKGRNNLYTLSSFVGIWHTQQTRNLSKFCTHDVKVTSASPCVEPRDTVLEKSSVTHFIILLCVIIDLLKWPYMAPTHIFEFFFFFSQQVSHGWYSAHVSKRSLSAWQKKKEAASSCCGSPLCSH